VRSACQQCKAAGQVLLPALVLSLSPVATEAQATPPMSWQRGATCYEVFVRSFADSDGDGIGDLRGLTAKLDYINDGNPRTTRDLGSRCIWLMPIAESPGYHGYDVSDYLTIEKDYGTNDQFKVFVREAHKRGIRVLVDMVLNHTSSEHPWFQAALRDTASPYRSYFRFSPTKGPNNRWGDNNWRKSPLRDEWYYAFFWQGMPDLNYEQPQALAEMKKVATFWLKEMNVDGFRLDAVKYLVERGAQAEDTPATHTVLREYAAHVRRTKPGALTIGEVFDSTGNLLSYYPDQLDSYFAFEVADSIIAGVRRGDARGVLAPTVRLQKDVPPIRWSPFLRNHDQPRATTELGGDVAKAKLAAALLLTMPGMPFVYYGEELGMDGPKPDEQIRTPMAWSVRGPHAGFTTGTPWQPLRADSLRANVEAQDGDSTSLLSVYRRLIHLRSSHSALGAGALTPLTSNNSAVGAYVRHDGSRAALVMVNLGDAVVTDLELSSPRSTLVRGRYALRDLLGSKRAADVTIEAGGIVRAYAPGLRIAPMSFVVFDLTPRR
jgi:alpha-amylase